MLISFLTAWFQHLGSGWSGISGYARDEIGDSQELLPIWSEVLAKHWWVNTCCTLHHLCWGRPAHRCHDFVFSFWRRAWMRMTLISWHPFKCWLNCSPTRHWIRLDMMKMKAAKKVDMLTVRIPVLYWHSCMLWDHLLEWAHACNLLSTWDLSPCHNVGCYLDNSICSTRNRNHWFMDMVVPDCIVVNAYLECMRPLDVLAMCINISHIRALLADDMVTWWSRHIAEHCEIEFVELESVFKLDLCVHSLEFVCSHQCSRASDESWSGWFIYMNYRSSMKHPVVSRCVQSSNVFPVCGPMTMSVHATSSSLNLGAHAHAPSSLVISCIFGALYTLLWMSLFQGTTCWCSRYHWVQCIRWCHSQQYIGILAGGCLLTKPASFSILAWSQDLTQAHEQSRQNCPREHIIFPEDNIPWRLMLLIPRSVANAQAISLPTQEDSLSMSHALWLRYICTVMPTWWLRGSVF